MTFEFSLSKSYLYDLLFLPKLLYYKDQKEDNELLQVFYEHGIKQDDDERMLALQAGLQPYKSTIEQYFYSEDFNEFDVMSLFIYAVPFFHFDSVYTYLKHIKQMNKEELLSLIYAQLIRQYKIDGADEDYHPGVNLVSLFQTLELEPGFKWTLLLLFDNPGSVFDSLLELYTNIEPLLQSVYQEDVIKEIGSTTVDAFNNDPEQAIKQLTKNRINMDILEGDVGYVFVSYIFPYTLSVAPRETYSILYWGYQMEYAFEFLEQLEQDKFDTALKIYKSLSDATKYGVLKLIAEGYTSVKDIASELGVSSATISYHMSFFMTIGLISAKKNNKRLGYIINYELLEETFQMLQSDLQFPTKNEQS